VAGTVYSQAGNGDACDTFCWTSSSGAGGTFQTYDNFSLSKSASVSNVSWQGFYWDGVTASNNPVGPDTNAWEIQFYSDNAGQPGTLLYSQTLPEADVTTTFLDTGSFNGSTVNVYDISAALPADFTASAGTTYWFSVLSEQTNFNPLFSWSPAVNQPPNAYSIQNASGGAYGVVADDRAFTLSAVPEPATWALMIAGFCGLGGALRLARQRRLAPAL
jgi:hypothetical protein